MLVRGLLGLALAAGLGLGLSSPASAWVPQELLGRRIVRIEVRGEAAGLVLPAELGLEPGATLERAYLRDTVERLLATGRWADVQLDVAVEGAGVVLYVELAARFVLARVTVTGNDVLDDTEILRALDLHEGEEMDRAWTQTEAGLAGLRARLARIYQERGYERVRAEFELRDTDDPSRKALVVRLEEGSPTRIARIVFEGEQPPREAHVERAMGIDAGDVFDRRAVDEALRSATQTLRDDRWYGAQLGLAGAVVGVCTSGSPAPSLGKNIGLGYLRLGQPATELSGGEAQRIKLATELQRPQRGDTLYVLDEPTSGLHPADVDKLMAQLQGLVDAGNTVVVVEHELRVIADSDWVIDLGPGAGSSGGRIVASGPPEQLTTAADSRTGAYLQRFFAGAASDGR